MEEHDLPRSHSKSADSAALRWDESHPDEDVVEHPTPVAPPEPDGVVPNHHSASAEAAALHWRETHPEEDDFRPEPE